ncbi:MAG: glycosyltransferase [Pseudomonadota bacterium]
MRLENDGVVGQGVGRWGASDSLSILSIIKLWPNVLAPQRGSQTEHRLRALQDLGGARIRVIAPIAGAKDGVKRWRRQVFAQGSVDSAVPDLEKRASIVVHHPRYTDYTRGAGADGGWIERELTRRSYRAAVLRAAQRLIRRYGPFDLIDAHGLAFDGWAARSAAMRSGCPLVVTAYDAADRLRGLSGAARTRAARTIVDARLLLAQGRMQAQALTQLGAAESRIAVIRPGVDLFRFKPEPEAAARARLKRSLGVAETAPLALSIADGEQGDAHHRLAIAAIAESPRITLRILGAGQAVETLSAYAARRGVAERIGFLDDPTDIRAPEIMRAADVALVLADGPGGRAVALECLASGAGVVVSPLIETEGVGESPAVEVAPISAFDGKPDLAGSLLAKRIAALTPTDAQAAAALRASARRVAEGSPLRHSVEDLAAAFRRAAHKGEPHRGGGAPAALEAAAAPER